MYMYMLLERAGLSKRKQRVRAWYEQQEIKAKKLREQEEAIEASRCDILERLHGRKKQAEKRRLERSAVPSLLNMPRPCMEPHMPFGGMISQYFHAGRGRHSFLLCVENIPFKDDA